MYYSTVSVRQRGKSWYARLKHKKLDGKWDDTERVLKGATGSRDAKKKAQALMNELNAAMAATAPDSKLSDTKQTVSKVVTEFIEGQYQRGEIESSTYKAQMTAFKANIEPYLGDVIFSTLDRAQIMDWYTKLANKGMSQHGVYYNYTIINKVYNYYLRIGEITKNPFRTLPKSIKKGTATRVTHLTAKQMEKFVQEAHAYFNPEDEMYPAVFLAFYAGLRRGEILGLRIRDIDLISGRLTVSTAIGIGEGGSYAKNPKNKSSARTFPMIPQLVTVLENRINAMKNPEPQDFICSNVKGHYLSPTQFSTRFHEFIEACNLRDAYNKLIIPHGLRHNVCTVGMRSDMDIAALSLMMGHASRSMTLDVYGDANKLSKEISAERLAETFRKESDLDE